ncbi:MAG: YSC84-like protein 1 [Acidobacteriaceae bacterium]|nr:YSC84-like protein 1 [Acidobacteriaceae bacterium]
MKRMLSLLALTTLALPLSGASKEEQRLQNCGTVLREIMDIPEDIPQDLIDKAECIIVFPSVLKAAFVVGGSYGRGAMTCRTGENYSGHWSAPSMMILEGGSVGFQIGGQATDFVLLVMNPRGAHSMLKNKVKLGADASVAAGPKGRTAEASTDAALRAEVLSYSRSRGLFAGVSLAGASVRPDNDANARIYGRGVVDAHDIIFGNKVKVPKAAQRMIAYLDRRSPKNTSDPRSLREN